MTRKNPFRIIRITAAAVGSIALLAFFAFLVVTAIIMAIEESGPHILWQVPLVFAVVFGLVSGGAFICSLVAKLWRKAERRWDQRRREVGAS